MRKFAIPKYVYVLLVLMLGVLSIGYTYAYFSSTHMAEAKLQLGYINVVWYDNNVSSVINGENGSIAITAEELDAGKFSKIQTLNEDKSETLNSQLSLLNQNATVSAYCRVKIDAIYTSEGANNSIACGEKCVQLARESSAGTIKVIDENGWFYHDGYYYFGTDDGSTKTLTKISANAGVVIATHIYLDPSVSADVYGASMSITLTVEAVQSTNNAYQSVWEVSW